ncbi:hypothetical protein JYU34_010081 [Plutella xylostella]|uniref:Uncharacterized protein n=1 Tax=Plutella xylostella TaxID=51655 RepID=A0ABQ7QI46_PLUXY|nr:hypothetical protein JYU34_010081 [Plutella xylostella]
MYSLRVMLLIISLTLCWLSAADAHPLGPLGALWSPPDPETTNTKDTKPERWTHVSEDYKKYNYLITTYL